MSHLDLMLPQIVRAVGEFAAASGIAAAIDLGPADRVLESLVLGHAAREPSWITPRSVATDLAEAGRPYLVAVVNGMGWRDLGR